MDKKHNLYGPFDLKQQLIDEAAQAFEKFMSKVVITDTDCWIWHGYKTNANNGYGQFYINHKQWLAHRWIFIRTIGPIPESLELDHLCRVRLCVNPLHLEPVTRSVNQLRGHCPQRLLSLSNLCKQGHSLEGLNVMVDKRGYRRCRICFKTKQKTRVRIRGRQQTLNLT